MNTATETPSACPPNSVAYGPNNVKDYLKVKMYQFEASQNL